MQQRPDSPGRPAPAGLRITAIVVGLLGAMLFARLCVQVSAGAGPALAHASSWVDRLALWLEVLLGGIGVLAAFQWDLVLFYTALLAAALIGAYHSLRAVWRWLALA
jgi:hypothetical protein